MLTTAIHKPHTHSHIHPAFHQLTSQTPTNNSFLTWWYFTRKKPTNKQYPLECVRTWNWNGSLFSSKSICSFLFLWNYFLLRFNRLWFDQPKIKNFFNRWKNPQSLSFLNFSSLLTLRCLASEPVPTLTIFPSCCVGMAIIYYWNIHGWETSLIHSHTIPSSFHLKSKEKKLIGTRVFQCFNSKSPVQTPLRNLAFKYLSFHSSLAKCWWTFIRQLFLIPLLP